MKLFLIFRSATFIAGFFAVLSVGQTATIAAVGEPTGGSRNDSYPWAGYGFYAPSTVGTMVNRLGYWDEGGDGLQSDHTVALFAYAGTGSDYTQIASVTVPAGASASFEGGYRWVAIPDLFLPDNGQNGNYYVVMASHGLDTWTNGLGSGAPMNPLIGTLSTGALDLVGEGPIFQIGSSGALYFGGPNVGYVIPESSSFALVGLSLAGLVVRRRR